MKYENATGTSPIIFPLETITEEASGGAVMVSVKDSIGFTSGVGVARVADNVIVKKMSDLSAKVVAMKIVDFCNDHGDLISAKKLQRILYYTQAWYLASEDKKLFDDPIFATETGVNQPSVAKAYDRFGHGPVDQGTSEIKVPEQLVDHIAEVMKAYGHLNAFDLELLIKEEEPWKAARRKAKAEDQNDDPPEISTTLMRDFYRLRLNG